MTAVKPRRPSSSARGYDRRWERFRAWLLAQAADLRCGLCRQPFTLAELATKGAIHVDHETPLAEGGARLDPSNARLAHAACHNRHTYKTRGPGKGRPVRGCDPLGLPLAPDHPWRCGWGGVNIPGGPRPGTVAGPCTRATAKLKPFSGGER